MFCKIKELIDAGYSIEFKSYVHTGKEIYIVLSKGFYHTSYRLYYSDVKNSILDPDVFICELLDQLKNMIDNEIEK